MPTQDVDRMLEQVEQQLRRDFPPVESKPRLEFTRQYFARHVELWIYTLQLNDYERIKASCDQISREKRLDEMEPEVWLLIKTWTGPWPGGETEQELRQRRDEFRRRHNLPEQRV